MLDYDALGELWEKIKEEDYLKFDKVKNRRSNRPDLHAFLLLDELVPCKRGCDIVSASEHDEFYLDTDVEKFCKVATEDHVRELIACGVMYTGDSFSMFA